MTFVRKASRPRRYCSFERCCKNQCTIFNFSRSLNELFTISLYSAVFLHYSHFRIELTRDEDDAVPFWYPSFFGSIFYASTLHNYRYCRANLWQRIVETICVCWIFCTSFFYSLKFADESPSMVGCYLLSYRMSL